MANSRSYVAEVQLDVAVALDNHRIQAGEWRVETVGIQWECMHCEPVGLWGMMTEQQPALAVRGD